MKKEDITAYIYEKANSMKGGWEGKDCPKEADSVQRQSFHAFCLLKQGSSSQLGQDLKWFKNLQLGYEAKR